MRKKVIWLRSFVLSDLGLALARRSSGRRKRTMFPRLIRLPAGTQTARQILSGIGNNAEVIILSIVLEASAEQVEAMFSEAVRRELIGPLKSSYRFIHNRVPESAYSPIPEERRARPICGSASKVCLGWTHQAEIRIKSWLHPLSARSGQTCDQITRVAHDRPGARELLLGTYEAIE